METEKTRDPGTNSGAVHCQKAISFRLWQKSVKFDGIIPELQGFYRTFVGFGHQKRATSHMMQLSHRQRSARGTVIQYILSDVVPTIYPTFSDYPFGNVSVSFDRFPCASCAAQRLRILSAHPLPHVRPCCSG